MEPQILTFQEQKLSFQAHQKDAGKCTCISSQSLHPYTQNCGLIKNLGGSLTFLPLGIFLETWKPICLLVLLFIVWSERAIANCKISSNLCFKSKFAILEEGCCLNNNLFWYKLSFAVLNEMSWPHKSMTIWEYNLDYVYSWSQFCLTPEFSILDMLNVFIKMLLEIKIGHGSKTR